MTASTSLRLMAALKSVVWKGMFHSLAVFSVPSAVRLWIAVTSAPGIFFNALRCATPMAPLPTIQNFMGFPRVVRPATAPLRALDPARPIAWKRRKRNDPPRPFGS